MNAIHPVLTLPLKHDISEQITDIIPVVLASEPEERLLFTGRMPLPPSVNQAYKIGYVDGHPRIIPSPALEAFKLEARVMLARTSQTFLDRGAPLALRRSRIKTPLAVTLRVYFLTEWRRDLDGVFKFAIDAACDYLQINDNQVVHVEAEKLVDAVDPRIEIELRCVAR